MSYPVWVRRETGGFRATVVGLPGVDAHASSREEALTVVKSRLRLFVESEELVEVELGSSERACVGEQLGVFAEDEDLGALFEGIEEARDADVR